MFRTFSLPIIKEIMKRRHPVISRQKLEDMVHCKDCKCSMRQEILSIGANPRYICQHYFRGICTLEEAHCGPHTLEEVGQIMGVSRERIRQIEDKTVKRLRHVKRSRKLRPFYEDSLERQKLNGRPYTLYSEENER